VIKELFNNAQGTFNFGKSRGIKARGNGSFRIPRFSALIAVVGLLAITSQEKKIQLTDGF